MKIIFITTLFFVVSNLAKAMDPNILSNSKEPFKPIKTANINIDNNQISKTTLSFIRPIVSIPQALEISNNIKNKFIILNHHKHDRAYENFIFFIEQTEHKIKELLPDQDCFEYVHHIFCGAAINFMADFKNNFDLSKYANKTEIENDLQYLVSERIKQIYDMNNIYSSEFHINILHDFIYDILPHMLTSNKLSDFLECELYDGLMVLPISIRELSLMYGIYIFDDKLCIDKLPYFVIDDHNHLCIICIEMPVYDDKLDFERLIPIKGKPFDFLCSVNYCHQRLVCSDDRIKHLIALSAIYEIEKYTKLSLEQQENWQKVIDDAKILERKYTMPKAEWQVLYQQADAQRTIEYEKKELLERELEIELKTAKNALEYKLREARRLKKNLNKEILMQNKIL